MLSISFMHECNTTSLIEHTPCIVYCCCINRSSLSHTNKEENDDLIVLCSVILFYQNNENIIHCLWVIKKGDLFIFFSSFLSLTMIHKKRTSLLSAKVRPDSSNYGKVDTFESIH
jgi:hypothetical protein